MFWGFFFLQRLTACSYSVETVLVPLTGPARLCSPLQLYLLLSDPFCSLSLKYESDELEKSVYQDYDSDSDVPEELKQDYVDEQTGDAPLKRSVPSPLV